MSSTDARPRVPGIATNRTSGSPKLSAAGLTGTVSSTVKSVPTGATPCIDGSGPSRSLPRIDGCHSTRSGRKADLLRAQSRQLDWPNASTAVAVTTTGLNGLAPVARTLTVCQPATALPCAALRCLALRCIHSVCVDASKALRPSHIVAVVSPRFMRLAYDVTQLLMAQTASNAGVGKAAPKAPKQASNEVQKLKNRPRLRKTSRNSA